MDKTIRQLDEVVQNNTETDFVIVDQIDRERKQSLKSLFEQNQLSIPKNFSSTIESIELREEVVKMDIKTLLNRPVALIIFDSVTLSFDIDSLKEGEKVYLSIFLQIDLNATGALNIMAGLKPMVYLGLLEKMNSSLFMEGWYQKKSDELYKL